LDQQDGLPSIEIAQDWEVGVVLPDTKSSNPFEYSNLALLVTERNVDES
jgi:hypothetical protein